MLGRVYFIGAGPGDPELLTLKGKKIIERADVIIYAGSLVNKKILSFGKKAAQIIDSASLSLNEITGAMIKGAKKGRTVARIHSGDPSIYGAIAEQMRALEKNKIQYEIIPGVSSAFAAAASLKIEYTLPEITQTLIVTRRAGKTGVPEHEKIQSLAAHHASMAIFLSTDMIADVVQELIAGGYPAHTPVAVVHKVSWPDEQQVRGTIKTISQKVKKMGITRQALILVGEAVGKRTAKKSKLYAPDFTHGFRRAANRKNSETAIVALTRRGWHTGKKLLHVLDNAYLYLPEKFRDDAREPGVLFYDDVRSTTERLFKNYEHIIFIMATGIVIRMIAPLVTSKWEDPAVIAMDESGRNIISLLSGHWGGANDLALKLSQILSGNPVITTESDVMGFPSIDLIVKSLSAETMPADSETLKEIQTAILEGRDVGFYPKDIRYFPGMEGHPNLYFFDSLHELLASRCNDGIVVSSRVEKTLDKNKTIYYIRPRDLVVGIGCHKGISYNEIRNGIESVFKKNLLSPLSIAGICSIDQKKNEKGLIDYARCHALPLRFFTKEDINTIKGPSPASKHVLRIMGVHGVAEPCAVLGSLGNELIVLKVKLKNMTLAVARIPLKQLVEESRI